MGMFDSFYDADGVEWQTKAFDCLLNRWYIGAKVPDAAPIPFQVKIFGGPLGEAVDSFATLRGQRLASLPDKRDPSLPLMDYGGGWIEVPDGVDVLATPASVRMTEDRLEYDKRSGKFDDIWLTGSDIHLEDMGSGNYFIGVYRPDGSQVAFNASKARVAWVHDPE